jgi:hypothetical protein
MKKNILNMIGIERCMAGWQDEAIEKEREHLKDKDASSLANIYQSLRRRRQGM